MEAALGRLDGVRSVSAGYRTDRAAIVTSPDLELTLGACNRALGGMGYRVLEVERLR